MNVILASIESRLKETAANADEEWFEMSPQQQKEYVRKHPSSKYAKGYNLKGDLLQHAKNNPHVIYHPDVTSRIEGDIMRRSYLHEAAAHHQSVLNHPDVSSVKSRSGETPLHVAATHFKEALNHPDADLVTDKYGRTPEDHHRLFGKE